MTGIEEQKTNTNSRRYIWLLLSLTVLVGYFYGLGSIPLLGPDEPRYAQVAREMYERNDWISPTLGGFNWFEKPALLYWLQIASYKIFGVSEYAARFGSAVFGLGTILCLWYLGKFIETKFSGNDRASLFTHHSSLKNWLFLVSASSIGLLTFSHAASFDIILTFPVTAALVSFFIYEHSDKKSSPNFYFFLFAFYFFIGLALLAKGLVGIVFPPAIVFFYYLLLRRIPDKTFVFSLLWGTLVSLLVASLWYAPVYLRHGWAFIDDFFIQHHFARYTSNKYLHPQPFYFFLLILPLMILPWTPFFAAALWNTIKDFFRPKRAGEELPIADGELQMANYELRIFALAWLLVPLVFFSFSGSKLPGYILPAVPGALILTGEYVSRFVRNSRKREAALQITTVLVFIGAGIFLHFFIVEYARHETVKYLIETADARGHSKARILQLHTISHNSEFYGAKRLVRNPDGKIRQFYGVSEIVEDMRRGGDENVLVLIPQEHVRQLFESDAVSAEILGDNGVEVMLAVNLKESETVEAETNSTQGLVNSEN